MSSREYSKLWALPITKIGLEFRTFLSGKIGKANNLKTTKGSHCLNLFLGSTKMALTCFRYILIKIEIAAT